MSTYGDKIKRAIENDITESEKKLQVALTRQCNTITRDIDHIEKILSHNKRRFQYELRQISKIRAYVAKYKFLPDSYRRLLDTWLLQAIDK